MATNGGPGSKRHLGHVPSSGKTDPSKEVYVGTRVFDTLALGLLLMSVRISPEDTRDSIHIILKNLQYNNKYFHYCINNIRKEVTYYSYCAMKQHIYASFLLEGIKYGYVRCCRVYYVK